MKKKQSSGLSKKAVIAIMIIVVVISGVTMYSYWNSGISSQYTTFQPKSPYDIMSESALTASNAASSVDSAKVQAQSAKSAALAAETAAKAAEGASYARGLSLFFWPGSEQSSAEITADYAERMVVFSATINMKVDNVDVKVGELTQLCLRYGGFVATVSTRVDGGAITLRIPQIEFYNAVAEVEGLGTVQSRDVKGEDVTDNYIDLEARLSTYQSQEARLLEILDVATTVEEILDVEAELQRVRGEIESLTGQLTYLESRIELATITILMNEAIEAKQSLFPEVNWWTPISQGLNALFTILQGLLSILTVAIPLLIIGIPSYLLYRRLRETYFPVTEDIEFEPDDVS